MRTPLMISGAIALTVVLTAPAHSADINGVQALAENVVGWINSDGRSWARDRWRDVSLTYPPTSFAWSTSEVVYGPPSGLSPAKPTALETLLAVNCGGSGSQPQVIIMAFKQSVSKTASTTVTQGVTVGQSLTLSANVPSWGTGISETTSVQYSTTTSSTASTTVGYAYSYSDQVTLDPGLKQSALLMVSFQDVSIPWSTSVVYAGYDQMSAAAFWVSWAHEPNPQGFAEHFVQMYWPFRNVLTQAQMTFPVTGQFVGVSASQATAVNGPTKPLTSADRAQYCSGNIAGDRAGRLFREQPGPAIEVQRFRPQLR